MKTLLLVPAIFLQKIFTNLITDNGFLSANDFFQSAYRFHTKFENIVIAGLTFAAFDNLFNTWFGMPMVAWLLFNVLVVFEFVTGISVAIRVRNEKVQSKKLSRGLFKVVVYTLTIGLLHLLSIYLPVGDFFQKNNLNPYIWMYHTVLHVTTILLLISLIENLGQLGVMDSAPILKIIRRKFDSWFELKDNENDETGQQAEGDSEDGIDCDGSDSTTDHTVQSERGEVSEEDL